MKLGRELELRQRNSRLDLSINPVQIPDKYMIARENIGNMLLDRICCLTPNKRGNSKPLNIKDGRDGFLREKRIEWECSDLADEGGPSLCLLGQLGVELLDLHESLSEHQCLLWLLQVLNVHLQSRKTRVPHVQLVPHQLSADVQSHVTV